MPLKELQWLTPFDEGVARHKQRADVEGGGCLWHTHPMQLYLECYCACRRYQDCHCGERRLR